MSGMVMRGKSTAARPLVWLAGLVVLLGVAPVTAQADQPMQFRIVTVAGRGACPQDCADVIAAEGEIDNETAGRLLEFLADQSRERDIRPVVLMESPGGTVVGAMQLGTVFRKIGAAVIVAGVDGYGDAHRAHVRPGLCMSACVYAFFGGARRVVPRESQLGIHRMVINEVVRDNAGAATSQQIFGSNEIVASLAAYTASMGVNPGVINFAETVAPEQIHIVTPHEIKRWRLGRPRL